MFLHSFFISSFQVLLQINHSLAFCTFIVLFSLLTASCSGKRAFESTCCMTHKGQVVLSGHLTAQRFKASEVMSCEAVNAVSLQSLFSIGEVYLNQGE